ncbi:MAG TPA: DUF4097 family beta strand repeat-containing protein [Gemmatimonadaceae bacterium]|nr:DUF4097 family beta strand repeat-containing protein [Gemmatimonadaceae bacterium]
MIKSILVIAIACAGLAPAASAQQQLGREGNTWRWDGRVESGRWMNIFNVNGSVQFLPSPDNMVHVLAEKTSSRGREEEVHYEVVQQGGNVTICAIWNDNATCEDNGYSKASDRNENNNTTVKFTVRVPRDLRVGANSVNGGVTVRDVGAEVKATTVNGSVEVRNASGRVRANTVNGAVDVNTSVGPVSAHTVNGNVEARMAALQGTDDMDFKTVNGSVTIIVPARFDADFRFDTVHGGISSDFPMTLTGRFGPRHARGTIGSGGRDIRASAVNGSIELRKQ